MYLVSNFEIFESTKREFSVLSCSEVQLDEFFRGFSVDQDGMRELSDWYNRQSHDVQEFLIQRFPRIGRPACSTLFRLYFSRIRDKIEQIGMRAIAR